MKKLDRNCPICGYPEGHVLYTQRFLLPKGHLLPSKYDIVCCQNCGFVFADTSANQEIYNQFYTEMSKYEDVNTASGGGDKPYDLNRLNHTADDIERILSNNKSANIIDLGCGNGGLIYILKLRGYENIVGLDPSISCVHTMKSKNLEAYQGNLFSKNQIGKTFDLIILSHVLEHIYDLLGAVSSLKDFLNPNGLVYVETPDAAKYFEYYIAPYHYFDTEHINHFSKKHHENIFRKCGYRLIASREKKMLVSENQYYPAVFSVFQFIEVFQKPTADFSLSHKIKTYIELSGKDDKNEQINRLFQSQVPIIIWGAGSYTSRMLSETNLGNCNILHFIDSDSKKWHQTINDKLILSPSLENIHTNNIVICSALYASEIEHQVKKINPRCELTIL